MTVKGPLLSGALGSAPTLAAVLRWTDGRAPIVVIGPPWLADAIASAGRALVLVEPDVRPIAVRARRRARKQNRGLEVALAGAELPLGRATLSALVVENVGGLQDDEAARWLSALVPCLRPGGRLIAADATSSTAVAARVAGAFLSAALTEIVQEWPRDGALLTIGVAPTSSVINARFADARFAGALPPDEGPPGTPSPASA
jgi:SAM-dependent methyltransferase